MSKKTKGLGGSPPSRPKHQDRPASERSTAAAALIVHGSERMHADELALAAWTAVAAIAFEAERLAYLERVAFEADLEGRRAEVDELERQLGRREAGRRYAFVLRLPDGLAAVAAVMVLSSSRKARRRAARLIVRALWRAASEAA